MSLASIVSRQSRAIVLIIALLSAAGLYAAFQLPVAIFPETDFPRIIIIIDNGVVPAQQMLASVTRPIEEAMNGIPGIVRIDSKTSRGAADIDLFFRWGVDIRETLQMVQARLSQLSTTLPSTISIRQVERFTFAVFPVSGYSLISDTRDPASLRDLATYTIKPRLSRLSGVGAVTIAGGKLREYHITVDPMRMVARSVSLDQVVEAVGKANIIASPGLIDENHHLELALVSGQARTPDELNSIVVAMVNNAAVTIGDIADVGTGVAPEYITVTADGRPAVLLNVQRQPDANTVAVVDEVNQEFEAMRPQLPKDVRIAPFYDQSLIVRSSIKSVRDAILIGLALSIAILYGFLRSWGTTLVAAVVIPVTVLVTFLVMWLAGLAFDLMTLGGIAAAIGLVIDDAIVVVENIYTHLERGGSRLDALHSAISEITVPIIGSTITPVVVFLPLTILTGFAGVFFRSLALTMAVALLTSLVLALSFTPVLAGRFVRRGKKAASSDEREAGSDAIDPERHRLLNAISRRYEWLLDKSLSHRWIVLAVCAATVLGSILIYHWLGSEDLPEFEEGAFVLDYLAPPGASLVENNHILERVEHLLERTEEVESYSRRTGLELGLAVTEPNRGDFLVKLKPHRKRATDEVISDLRKKIESSEPALHIEFVGILGDLIGDLSSSPEPVEIKVFSEDTKALHKSAAEIEETIKKIDGIVDTKSGIVLSGPAVTFRVDPRRSSQLGVNASDIATTVTTAMTGEPASAILQQSRLITVRVNLPQSTKESLDALKALEIRSAKGSRFRLDQVADVEYDPGQAEINREGLRQMVAVTARLENVDLGTAIVRVREKLSQEVKLPPGMTIEFGGLYKEQQTSFRELTIALTLAVALVFITLLIEFQSFVHPIAIVSGSVLALGGVFAALFITRSTLNIVSYVGMIMVVGIVAKNGILMLDAVEEHIAAGDTLKESLVRSGRRRFRPVLMTSLAAMLGMLPLALALGSGAELLQPLAISVIGGLCFALLLSLVVTPTVYSLLRRESSIEESGDVRVR
ncbi:MAG TPA: efflux RND transporter permease subunit [Blastocatellia bacterium]|nr:efflux RND transporter permease subunit [Blastocatellia bacterium]